MTPSVLWSASWVLAIGTTLAGAAGAFTLRVAGAPHVAKDQVYDRGGCGGANRSPALEWSAPPGGTRSLAVTMFDPDAPGHGWWHWIVADLPASLRALPAGAGRADGGALPPGAFQGRNDFGEIGYGGPCPPAGDPPHHYVITVWALRSARLEIDPHARGSAIEAALRRDAIASARAELAYGRSRTAR